MSTDGLAWLDAGISADTVWTKCISVYVQMDLCGLTHCDSDKMVANLLTIF